MQAVEALSPKNRMATLFFYYDILERKGSLISIGNLGDSGQGPPSQVEGPTEIAATAKQPRNGRSNEGRPAPSEHKPQYKAGIRPHNAPKEVRYGRSCKLTDGAVSFMRRPGDHPSLEVWVPGDIVTLPPDILRNAEGLLRCFRPALSEVAGTRQESAGPSSTGKQRIAAVGTLGVF